MTLIGLALAIDLPPLRERPTPPPPACRGEDVDPGVPATCYGVAISVEASEYVELVEADARLLRTLATECDAGRRLDAATHADALARLESERRDARRAGRGAAVRAGLVGVAVGVVAGAVAATR